MRLSDEALAKYVGTYETIIILCEVTAADGQLVVELSVKPEMRQTLIDAGQDPDEAQPPMPLGLLSDDGDTYIITDGGAKGMRGYFRRARTGRSMRCTLAVGWRRECRRSSLIPRRALGWPLVWDANEQTAIQSPLGRTGQRFDRITVDPAGEVERLVSLGATRLSELSDGVVLADPDGNEFGIDSSRS